MYYSKDALKQLAENYAALKGKYETLLFNYISLGLTNPRAQEFARHGFPRRLGIMHRCVVNVFKGIPPERTDLPSRDELTDCTINIQSFIFNVFGALDNLAWIWMAENGQKRADGTPIPDSYVGLGPDNTAVRNTFSKELQDYLRTLDAWFRYLADIRHALAHRIPLYIPPYVVSTKDEVAYREYEEKMSEASKKRMRPV